MTKIVSFFLLSFLAANLLIHPGSAIFSGGGGGDYTYDCSYFFGYCPNGLECVNGRCLYDVENELCPIWRYYSEVNNEGNVDNNGGGKALCAFTSDANFCEIFTNNFPLIGPGSSFCTDALNTVLYECTAFVSTYAQREDFCEDYLNTPNDSGVVPRCNNGCATYLAGCCNVPATCPSTSYKGRAAIYKDYTTDFY